MSDLSLVPEAAWRGAQRRAEVIRPLAERESQPRHLVRAAAAALGLSERQAYTLLRRCCEPGGAVTALVPGMSSGGRNKQRVPPASEAALTRAIHEVFLTPQKPTTARVAREVIERCKADKLPAPSASTATDAALLAGEERIGAAALERADYQPPTIRRRMFEQVLR